MKFNNKKYLLIFILSVFVTTITLIGGSYALIQKILVGSNTYSLKVGNFLVEFGDTEEISLSNQLPVYDNIGMENSNEMVFAVTNNGSYVSSYSVKIVENNNTGLVNAIRYAINYGDGYSYDNVHALSNNQYIIQNKRLEKAGTDIYKLKFWLDIDASEEYVSKTFSAKVVVTSTQEEYKYASNILDAVYNLENKDGLQAVNKEGNAYQNGVIKEYHYGESNPNNYVWFNCDNGYTKGKEHCEKWRILGSFTKKEEDNAFSYRTIKLVKDEALTSNQKYNTNTGNKADFNNASIKTYLNETYYNTLKNDAKEMIMKADFNNGVISLTNKINETGTLEGQSKSYNYVGLLNISDLGYAQSNSNWCNTLSSQTINNWLYQSNLMLLNTKDLTGTSVYYLNNNSILEGNTTTNYSIKPVVYLKPDVSIISGYGTSDEPYELSIKFPMEYGKKTDVKCSSEVIYNLNGGSGNIEKTYQGEAITSEIPTNGELEFLGWSTSASSSTVAYKPGATYDGDSDLNLYAVWGEKSFMNDFSAVPNINTATEIHFISITDEEIEALDVTTYDLTYANKGKVTAWYDKTNTTVLYVGSTGKTYLNKSRIFPDSIEMLDTTNMDTSYLTDMTNMFDECFLLREIIGVENWNVSNVTSMAYLFGGPERPPLTNMTELDLSKWDVSNVTDMSDMFNSCRIKILGLSNWDVSNVTDMRQMFNFYSGENLDLSNWDVSNVTDMRQMFNMCKNLTTIYTNTNWQTVATKLTNSSGMFEGCTKLVGAVSFNSSNTDISMANPDTGYFTRKG